MENGESGFGREWRLALECHPEISVVAIVETDGDALHEAGDALGVPVHHRFHPLRGDWANVEADFVIDSSPPEFRVSNVIRAFAAGMDALVAKPMGTRSAMHSCFALARIINNAAFAGLFANGQWLVRILKR